MQAALAGAQGVYDWSPHWHCPELYTQVRGVWGLKMQVRGVWEVKEYKIDNSKSKGGTEKAKVKKESWTSWRGQMCQTQQVYN